MVFPIGVSSASPTHCNVDFSLLAHAIVYIRPAMSPILKPRLLATHLHHILHIHCKCNTHVIYSIVWLWYIYPALFCVFFLAMDCGSRDAGDTAAAAEPDLTGLGCWGCCLLLPTAAPLHCMLKTSLIWHNPSFPLFAEIVFNSAIRKM